MNTQIAVILGELTSELQPLSIFVNKLFKRFIVEEQNNCIQQENFSDSDQKTEKTKYSSGVSVGEKFLEKNEKW